METSERSRQLKYRQCSGVRQIGHDLKVNSYDVAEVGYFLNRCICPTRTVEFPISG